MGAFLMWNISSMADASCPSSTPGLELHIFLASAHTIHEVIA